MIEKLGKVVVERADDGFLVMFPDGSVKGFSDIKRIEKAAKRWFEGHTKRASVGSIEWPAAYWPGRPSSLLGKFTFQKVG